MLFPLPHTIRVGLVRAEVRASWPGPGHRWVWKITGQKKIKKICVNIKLILKARFDMIPSGVKSKLDDGLWTYG